MLLPDIPRSRTWSPEHMRHGHASAAALNAKAKAEFIASRSAA